MSAPRTYSRVDGRVCTKGTGSVVARENGVLFWCPCDFRVVHVSSPPHKISFDGQGRLTLVGSCGFRAHGKRPEIWCHFSVSGGVATMHGDSQCPGVGGAT